MNFSKRLSGASIKLFSAFRAPSDKRNMTKVRVLPVLLILTLSVRALSTQINCPNASETPGALCSINDPDFDSVQATGNIAHCKRHLSVSAKKTIAIKYGVPRAKWKEYEFDHLIPLCAGGASNTQNIWPQPLSQAKKKDTIERSVCRKVARGKMTQREAVREIFAWFRERGCDLADSAMIGVRPSNASDAGSQR